MMFSISTMASSTRMPTTSDRRQQRHDVDREAEHVVHHREGRDHRQRQRGGGHQRGAPVAQEQPDHQHRQRRAFVQQVIEPS
jgi:hypothetical protein